MASGLPALPPAPVMDTLGVRGAMGKTGFVLVLAAALPCAAQPADPWPAAVAHAARLAPQARIVVLDAASGRLLASSRLSEAAHTLATPGSTLKPLALYALVQSGRWDPVHRIACARNLRVAGHSLACSHPPADPMDAREALTWSCNSYFAALAATLAPGELRPLLAPTGLLSSTGLTEGEALAEFRAPRTPDDTRLALLGVNGVRITPLELAAAYRWLAAQLAAHPDSRAAQVVKAGLTDSASFGIAGAASLGGVPLAGKTGTAAPDSGGQTHGWFAALAPAEAPQVVLVVYLPAGHGADAAQVAADLLAHSPLRQP